MSSELGRRIAFTLGALLVYRIGTHIPLPGIDLTAWEQIFRSQGGGVLGMANMLSGGAVSRLSLFALSITPYISAAIIVQLVSFFFTRLRALRSRGEQGRRRIEWYTRALTLLMAAFQSYGIALGLAGVSGLVADPGPLFLLSVTLTLTGGTLFLMWLSEQITQRGIGNGVALILCVGIVAELPQAVFGAFELSRQGVLSGNLLLGLAVLSVALVGFVAFMEMARRLLPIEYSGGRTVYLSLKLNSAGVMPSIIASWLLLVILALVSYAGALIPDTWQGFLGQSGPLFMLGYAVIIFVCVFLYTAFVLDPAEAAANLQKYGGAIPQVEPGEPTADHLDQVLSRVTLIGAAYFVTICLIPELLISWTQVPFYLGGTSLLVLVCTVLDLRTQAKNLVLVRSGG